MSIVRVLVVDDHRIFREGLQALLSRIEGIEVVAQAETAAEAIAAAAEFQPDVVLMDLELPDGSGVDATAEIVAKHPNTSVVMLTVSSSDSDVRHAIRAGARGYVIKDADPPTLVGAIKAAHRGHLTFDKGVAAHVLSAAASPEIARPFPKLTEREYEILDHVAQGLSNSQIAARMHLTLKTVQNNVSSILSKLGARDRAQAVVFAHNVGVGVRR